MSTLNSAVLDLGRESAAPATEATGIPCVDVAPQAWHLAAEALAEAGAQLDWLTGVDLGAEEIEVVAMFIAGDDSLLVRTRIGYIDSLPTLGDLFPSAPWHERGTSEMLGVVFDGGDPRRLWLPEEVSGFPLRRDFPLQPRLDTQWPGDSGGRRSRVPGINPEWRP